MSKKVSPPVQQVFDAFIPEYTQIPLEVFTKPFEVLVSTMLSARTRDEVTKKVCEQKLFKKAKTPEQIVKLSARELENLVYPVSFYRNKSKALKKLAQSINDDFHGKVPQTREELITLPGVGNKTASLVLARAFGVPAIAVDTHVNRISNMLGWVNETDPDKVSALLQEIVPKNQWIDVNKYFVSVGQKYRSKKQLKEFFKSKALL
ncbi:endonuclease III [candidate division WWE3 bacterium CG_4_10_14_0_2_um_filter_41_14]|uniref:Endonuclease III n=1 Tax=candidate division WWE3 bacterium CG_4_10_14_0_2_um_filter_41_14 TaxID=1975072 RepID=A0A2M7TL38_UNCKA|nr:MAG: endonuclease III [candidate division WWE3 bacterium CG_4_10_14_0_2_um_filter_41_14]